MFKKILIANRGEIAVRVIRTCRDMGIATVALVSQNDRNALHVRLADECYPITSEKRFGDGDEVLAIAKACGADAIHPCYGFLAEQPEFAEAWNKRATVLYLMGDYQRSVADVEQTLALEPRHFGALAGLGLINLALDREVAALRAFEAALNIHPQQPGLRAKIKELRTRLGGKPT